MSLYRFDWQIRQEGGFTALCGVDEAGRGPLAGPVYAAAVILPADYEIPGLNDSKKLTEKARSELYGIIVRQAAAWCIATASESEIDEMNILWASMLAMRRAVEGLSKAPEYVLVDGNRVPDLTCPAQAVVQGDAKSACIAAASILAKVARDNAMRELDALYPQYAFAQHKGYPTKLHYEKLAEHGKSPVHRQSFLAKWEKSRA